MTYNIVDMHNLIGGQSENPVGDKHEFWVTMLVSNQVFVRRTWFIILWKNVCFQHCRLQMFPEYYTHILFDLITNKGKNKLFHRVGQGLLNGRLLQTPAVDYTVHRSRLYGPLQRTIQSAAGDCSNPTNRQA